MVALLPTAQYYAGVLAKTCRGRHHSVEDLTQEALLGLLGAIETFDPQAGYRFDCYAGVRMHGAARRFLAEDARCRHERRDFAA